MGTPTATTASNPHTVRLIAINSELEALQIHFQHGIESQQDAQRAVDDICAEIRDAEKYATAKSDEVGAVEVPAELGRGDVSSVAVAVDQASAAARSLAKASLREPEAQRHEGRLSGYAEVTAEIAADMQALRAGRARGNLRMVRHIIDQDHRDYETHAAALARTVARLALLSDFARAMNNRTVQRCELHAELAATCF